MSCLYIWEINPLSVAMFANIFSHSEGCLFILFMVSFALQELFKFNWVSFVYFCFNYSRRWIKKDVAALYVRECSAYVFLNSFKVSGLTFRSLIYFGFIFVYGVKECSNFILLH